MSKMPSAPECAPKYVGGVNSFGYSGTIVHCELASLPGVPPSPQSLAGPRYVRRRYRWRETPHPLVDERGLARSSSANSLTHALRSSELLGFRRGKGLPKESTAQRKKKREIPRADRGFSPKLAGTLASRARRTRVQPLRAALAGAIGACSLALCAAPLPLPSREGRCSPMVKYSRDAENSTKSCKASGSDLRVHFKNTCVTADAIRHMPLKKAKKYLEDVLEKKQ
ncbi:hypothetical protein EMIHUDRAFT_243741, partial [Emiliania huxleyi CCMP1516]|uniref:Uncharacterized protein n=2 Tax=Emiliania huxleyi TaxID=2903 RepID=A0A0D3J4Z1_EMIH1